MKASEVGRSGGMQEGSSMRTLWKSRMVFMARRPAPYVLAAFVALTFALVRAPTADSAFPGFNGRVAFTAGSMSPDPGRAIFTISPNGNRLRQLTSGDAAAIGPVWSADGERIAFSFCCRNDSWEIATMSSDGSNRMQITNDSSHDFVRGWSPDGTQLLFVSNRATPDQFNVWVMNADGSEPRRLASIPFSNDADFSPDGTTIAFPGEGRVWLMNADGSDQRAITPPMGISSIDWSPDGRQLLFTNGDLWLVNADGTGLRNLTETSFASDGAPVFSPDGQRIIWPFQPAGGNSHTLWVMDVDGSNAHELAPIDVTFDAPSWQPLSSPLEEPLDTSPPTILVFDVTAEAEGPEGAFVSYNVTAKDDVDLTVHVDCSPPSGSTFPIGVTTVMCSATDNAGNTGTQSFQVTVLPRLIFEATVARVLVIEMPDGLIRVRGTVSCSRPVSDVFIGGQISQEVPRGVFSLAFFETRIDCSPPGSEWETTAMASGGRFVAGPAFVWWSSVACEIGCHGDGDAHEIRLVSGPR